ncbi:MAG: PEFG-CTERM sorting domain-containing protein [Nitrososphaera sp.]
MEYKSYALMAILLASVAAVGTIGVAHAQSSNAITTDKADYGTGDTIKVSGKLSTAPTGQPLLIRVFDPKGSIVKFDQFAANADGTFTYSFKSGGIMKTTGDYKATVTYNGADVGSATFKFTAASGGGPVWKTIKMQVGNSTFDIKYQITGGTLNSLVGDHDTTTITGKINATTDGQLIIQLPRTIADSKGGNGTDTDYVVFVDGIEEFADDDHGAATRTVTIPFAAQTEQIDITGTMLVPEFGAIAAIVLAVAIVGIIVATTRYSKFSFLPKM